LLSCSPQANFSYFQDLSKMMESGSAIISASSLSSYGCIPLGPSCVAFPADMRVVEVPH